MGIHKLLERLGFVRLRDYGLLLTPDGRVVTTRKVIDDGFGTQIVGYPANELPIAEPPTPPPVPIPATPLPALFTITPPPSVVAAPEPPPQPPQEPEEDEWEWEIAAARARAEAEPVPPARTPQWLTPEPLTNGWSDDATTIRSVTKLARVSEQQLAGDAQPRTIIPVPSLPVARDPSRVRPYEDATRQLPIPRRLARGTGNISG